MNNIQTSLCILFGAMSISSISVAQNQWAGYASSNQTAQQQPPQYQPQGVPPKRPYAPPPHSQPSYRPPMPPQQNQPSKWGSISMQSGINLQYQAPTTIYQNTQQYSWVNGDPRVAQIESTTHNVITDWQRIGLPAPPSGTYWVFENGRYVIIPNR